jgi:hypothetical protein
MLMLSNQKLFRWYECIIYSKQFVIRGKMFFFFKRNQYEPASVCNEQHLSSYAH